MDGMSEPYRVLVCRGCPNLDRAAIRADEALRQYAALLGRGLGMEKSAGDPRRGDRDRHSLRVSLREMEHVTAGVAPEVIHVGAGAWVGQETGRTLTLRTGGRVHGGQSVAAPARPPLSMTEAPSALPGIGAQLLALLPCLACGGPALLANAFDVWFRQRRYACSGTLLRRNFVCLGLGLSLAFHRLDLVVERALRLRGGSLGIFRLRRVWLRLPILARRLRSFARMGRWLIALGRLHGLEPARAVPSQGATGLG